MDIEFCTLVSLINLKMPPEHNFIGNEVILYKFTGSFAFPRTQVKGFDSRSARCDRAVNVKPSGTLSPQTTAVLVYMYNIRFRYISVVKQTSLENS